MKNNFFAVILIFVLSGCDGGLDKEDNINSEFYEDEIELELDELYTELEARENEIATLKTKITELEEDYIFCDEQWAQAYYSMYVKLLGCQTERNTYAQECKL